ncbi:hypothetical protein OEZ71_03500 [Defluviimonas sp. WL0050]|uniref:PH domain-containing protein n=1 Tax=Albidovulum litorale TaxID=2984134 RepID=A0ABT2ZJP1_9RHOB|nr:hypothetical protein [Defluviimonas sp. WL0050]MCV2871354.1 hypothetical protein [Defluviimonas sp. WL0050]
MRILNQNNDQLIVEEKPWFWALCFVFMTLSCAAWAIDALSKGNLLMTGAAAASTLGCLALTAFAVERVWLILDRRAGTVELRRRNWRGFRSETFPLSDLDPDGVLLQSNDDMWRIALQFSSREKPVPLTGYYQTGTSTRRCAETARKWLGQVA